MNTINKTHFKEWYITDPNITTVKYDIDAILSLEGQEGDLCHTASILDHNFIKTMAFGIYLFSLLVSIYLW